MGLSSSVESKVFSGGLSVVIGIPQLLGPNESVLQLLHIRSFFSCWLKNRALLDVILVNRIARGFFLTRSLAILRVLAMLEKLQRVCLRVQ